MNLLFPPFSSIERRVLEDLVKHADKSVARRLSRRIRQINLVQRSSDKTEVIFYWWANGSVKFDSATRLAEWPGRTAKLAQAIYKTGSGQLKVRFRLVDGQLSAMELSAPLSKRHKLSLISMEFRPMADADSDSAREALARKLPQDYVGVARSADVQSIAGCTIFGVDEVYSVHRSGRSMLVLAEIHDKGVIGIDEDTKEERYWFLGYEGEGPIDVGTDFRRSVESALHN